MVYIPLMLLLLCPSYGQFPNNHPTADLPEQQQPKSTFNAHPSSHRRLQFTSSSGSSTIDFKEGRPARSLHESMRSKYNNYSQRVQQDRVLHPSHQLHSSWPSSIDMYRFKRDGTGSFDNIVKKLELVEYLTNGLVLTEALQSNKIKIGEITTDLLIVGQMPKDKDWIEILETSGVDKGTTAKIDEFFNELKPLQDAIENGKSINVPNHLLDKIMHLLESFRSVDRLIKTTKFLETVISEYNKSSIRISKHKDQILFVLKFQSGIEQFSNVKGDSKKLESFLKGKDVIFEAKKYNTHSELQTGYEACKKYEQDKNLNVVSLFSCIQNIARAVSSLSLNDVRDEQIRNSFSRSSSIFSFLAGAKRDAEMKEVFNKELEFEALSKSINKIKLAADDGLIVIDSTDEKGLQSTISELKSTNAADLSSLSSSLAILKPIAQIIENVNTILKSVKNPTSQNPDIQFVNHLKSYSALSDGINSLDLVTQNVGSTHALTPAVLMSGMVKRVESIKSFVAQLNPVVQNSVGFRMIGALVNGVSEINKLIASPPSDNLTLSFATIQTLTKDFPVLNNTSELLNEFIPQLKSIKASKIEKDLIDLTTPFSVSDTPLLTELEKSYLMLPEFIKFTSELQDVMKDVDMKDNSQYDSYFSKLQPFFENFESALNMTRKLDEATPSISPSDTNLEDVLQNLKTVFDKKSNFSIHHLSKNDFSEDFIRLTVDESKRLQNKLYDVINSKTEVVKYAADLKVFDKVKQIGSSTPDEVTSSRALLEELTKMKKIDIKIEESDAIAQLMPGSSFGSEILENLHHGVTAYSNIVDGAESMETLKRSISTLKPTNGALMGRVEKLLNGFEVVKITKDDSDFNVFNVIADATKTAENADKLKEWIEKVDQNERVAIERELASMTKSRRLKRKVVSDAQTLQKVVSGLNTKSAQKIGKLSTGLRSLSSALTYANCDKNPNHVSCDKSTSNWIVYGGIVCLCLVCILLVVVILLIRQKIKSKKLNKMQVELIGMLNEKIENMSMGVSKFFGDHAELPALHSEAKRNDDFPYYIRVIHQMFDSASNKVDPKKCLDLGSPDLRYPNRPLLEHNALTQYVSYHMIHGSKFQTFNNGMQFLAYQTPFAMNFNALHCSFLEEKVETVIQFVGLGETDLDCHFYLTGACQFWDVTHREDIFTKNMVRNEVSIKDRRPKPVNPWGYTHFLLRMPENEAVENPYPILDLVKELLEDQKNSKHGKCDPPGVMAVVSQKGIGRAGVFILVAFLCDQIDQNIPINLVDAITYMRSQRAEAIPCVGHLAMAELLAMKYLTMVSPSETREKCLLDWQELDKLYKNHYKMLNTLKFGKETLEEMKRNKKEKKVIAKRVPFLKRLLGCFVKSAMKARVEAQRKLGRQGPDMSKTSRSRVRAVKTSENGTTSSSTAPSVSGVQTSEGEPAAK